MKDRKLPGGVPAGYGCGLAFGSVRGLLAAGELLKVAGFSVFVVPRRIAGCGVLLLVPSDSATAALALLDTHGIKPTGLVPYRNTPAEVITDVT